MNVVGIVAALAAEAHSLAAPAALGNLPTALEDGTLVCVSGIGAVAAAAASHRLIGAGATALASWGMAGGLDPGLAAGAIFLPSSIISRSGACLPTTGYWREQLGAALLPQQPIASGKLLTSDVAIDAVAAKAAAFRETGALAVDMESLAIAEVAATHHMPFIAVRVIVDTAHDVLPLAVVAATRAGHVQLWRLLCALAVAPTELAAVLRLSRRYKAARRSLVAIARAGALAPLAAASLQ